MNPLERQMVEILQHDRDVAGVVAVKAEFEAEGTRTDELLRLVDVARSAGVGIALKIGGCEAVRDLLEAKQIGVNYIIAPMIETPYALSKFRQAIGLTFTPEERVDVRFLFNIETQTAFTNRQSLCEMAGAEEPALGVVFGRVDFSGSLRLSREGINEAHITEYIITVSAGCAANNLDLVVGGAISVDSLPALRLVAGTHLTRFETRKVIFDADVALKSDAIETALINAVHFELLWLKNKRDYYRHIAEEDEKRITMLEQRWGRAKAPVHGW